MNLKTPISAGGRSLKMYASRLEKLNIFTFEDLLLHLPFRYEDFSLVSGIGNIQAGETVTIKGEVTEIKNQYMRGARIKTMQKATIEDNSGNVDLIWFNQPFITKTLVRGSTVSVSGRVSSSKKGLVINSPAYEVIYNSTTSSLHTGRLIPIYPETKGISSKWLRRQIHNVLESYGKELDEYLPEEIIRRHNYFQFDKALREVHFPESIESAQEAKRRLGFDELLILQLSASKKRKDWKEKKISSPFNIKENEKKIDEFIKSLPFELTASQVKAYTEILTDLGSDNAMNRLLQGDVGSGKTVISAISMYEAYLNGFQSVLMAPTEILAKQHYDTIHNLLSRFGVRTELVTGNTNVKNKKKSIADFDILIGTHAVLSDKITYSKLGLVVIDEQQRFGVEQRGGIRAKGKNPHLLTMTATPIPRTVALTMYGDLDLSYLNEMPKSRKRVKTWLVPPEKRSNAYEWIRKQIKDTDSQTFIICPFIEESESMQTVKAANHEYEKLRKEIYPDLKLGILHGKLKSKEKEDVLNKFRGGAYDILVATPVVEVGIDIPNATIIMIEASERFGLAQLHQLRGRVGRSEKQSYCLLFTDSENEQTSKRLKGMETLYSGAELAELDLKLRGPGNMYGTNQHGIPSLKAASFSDTELIQIAKHEADKILNKLENYPLLKEKVENVTTQKVSPD